MPEYGLTDKSPEKIAEEQFAKESAATFKRAEILESQDRRRRAESESSNIQTAETLRHVENQIQILNQKMDIEHQERLRSEKTAVKFQWANLILVALTFVATVVFGLGLRSCTSEITDDTNGTQESEFATSDSAPK